jgi:hypothetical protein
MRKIKEGEMLSFTNYYKVLEHNDDQLKVVDLRSKDTVFITGETLIELLQSNDYYEKTVVVTKAQMVETLLSAGQSVFTVGFKKADGSDRVIIGCSPKAETHLGRTQVVDLEVIDKDPNDKTKGIRLIDNRTIEFLVLNKVRYNLK